MVILFFCYCSASLCAQTVKVSDCTTARENSHQHKKHCCTTAGGKEKPTVKPTKKERALYSAAAAVSGGAGKSRFVLSVLVLSWLSRFGVLHFFAALLSATGRLLLLLSRYFAVSSGFGPGGDRLKKDDSDDIDTLLSLVSANDKGTLTHPLTSIILKVSWSSSHSSWLLVLKSQLPVFTPPPLFSLPATGIITVSFLLSVFPVVFQVLGRVLPSTELEAFNWQMREQTVRLSGMLQFRQSVICVLDKQIGLGTHKPINQSYSEQHTQAQKAVAKLENGVTSSLSLKLCSKNTVLKEKRRKKKPQK